MKAESTENPENIIKNSRLPVLIDFYADWCEPCKLVPAELEKVERKLQGKIKILKIKVETFPDIALMYKVKSVPTLVLIKDGNVLWRMQGFELSHRLSPIISELI